MNIHLGIALALVVAGSALVASSLGDDGTRARVTPADATATRVMPSGDLGVTFHPWTSAAGQDDTVDHPAALRVPTTRG